MAFFALAYWCQPLDAQERKAEADAGPELSGRTVGQPQVKLPYDVIKPPTDDDQDTATNGGDTATGGTTGLLSLQKEQVTVYPNPAGSFVTVRTSDDRTLVLYAFDGSEVLHFRSNTRQDLSTLNPGVYLIVGEGIRERLLIGK